MNLKGQNAVKLIAVLIALKTMFPLTETIAQNNRLEDQGATDPWTIAHHDSKASLRGLFVVDTKTIWASGSGGTVIRSIDGGSDWESVGPPDTTNLDFRDVYAFDSNNAIVISAGSPARIYRTSNGGKDWSLVFEDGREAAFFDAMSFWDRQRGIAFSDPIEGRLLVIETTDGGASWREIERNLQPQTIHGEAGFAASGTCLCVQDDVVWIGLGGARPNGDQANGDQANGDQAKSARILRSGDYGKSWEATSTPMASGEASGVFSIAFADRNRGVAVGGTYTKPEQTASNICITEDGGLNWHKPSGAVPRGYRSCVAVRRLVDKTHFVCVGRNGCDISDDNGTSWTALSDEPFHAVAFSNDGKIGVAVGRDGKIGLWK